MADQPKSPTEAAAAAAQPPEQKPTFDLAVCERLRAAFADVFLHHPEVKTLGAAICWQGNLNDAQIMHGLWLCPDGPVVTPDGVIGSAFQTLKLLDEQVGRVSELVSHMRDQAIAIGEEATKKHEELQEVEAQIARRKEELDRLGKSAQAAEDVGG